MELIWKAAFVVVSVSLIAGDNNVFSKDKRVRNKQSFREYLGNLQEFSSDIYRELAREKPGDADLIFSPYSIESALMMALIGADGKTWVQIRKGMKMGTNRQLRNNTKRFRSRMESLPDGYFFETANRVFYQNGSTISEHYLRVVENVVGSMPQAVDYERTEQAKDTINRWVEKKTRNKIKDLIPDGVLDQMIRMVLVNAVYFKADWKTKFDPEMTDMGTFFAHDGEKDAELMDVTSGFRYMEDDECDFKAVEMPYKGDKMSMVLILPMERTISQRAFRATEKCIVENFARVGNGLMPRNVHIRLPKFKITQDFDLKEPLKRLSIVDLFVQGVANLTRMDPTGDLYVSDALHKAFIEVNEEGSEAAAATAIVARGRSAFGGDEEVMEFNADHPFMFFIKHKRGGVIFMGRVMNPVAGNP